MKKLNSKGSISVENQQAQGRLLLCGMRQHVREVFEISGFLQIIDSVADCSEGLRKLNA